MAGLNSLHVAAFNGGVVQALSGNVANVELWNTEWFQTLLSRDVAMGAALALKDSTAVNIATIDVAAVVGAATAEGSDAAPTNLTTALIPITPARQSLTFDLGDSEDSKASLGALWPVLNTIANANLSMSPNAATIKAMNILGAAAWWGVINRIVAQIKALVSGFATVSGVALNPYTRVLFEAAINTAIGTRGNRGNGLWVGHETAWGTVSADYAALLGAGQFSAGAQIAIDRGPGNVTPPIYRGVRHATLTGLPNDGAGSTYGAIMWPEAVNLITSTPKLGGDAILVGIIGDPANPIATIEMRRVAGGTTRFTITFWTGIGERQDLAGVTTISTT